MNITDCIALRFIRGEITEEELRASIRPTKGEFEALKREVARLRLKCDALVDDLTAAHIEIDKLSGRN